MITFSKKKKKIEIAPNCTKFGKYLQGQKSQKLFVSYLVCASSPFAPQISHSWDLKTGQISWFVAGFLNT